VTTVLIFEDRRGVREGLARAMSAVAGVRRIDSVMTGEELLARYTRQPTDLVPQRTADRRQVHRTHMRCGGPV
jgi:DNA-binding NarL/FixJ family response regulator